MKFKSLLFAACALGMMASCTDKDDIVNPDDGFDPNGEGYVCFTLNLPVSAGTRAENDDFDDGIASEYAVKNATLVLFEGGASSTEYTATLASAYDLSTSWKNLDDDPNQITVTSQIVQKVQNPTASTNKFYAYIILNHPVNIYVKDKMLVDKSSGTEKSLSGKTYTELRQLLVNDETDAIKSADIVAGKEFITMTNAPLAKYTGSASAKPAYDTITVMPAIAPEKIKATEAQAQADPACEVYVERILAKVTLRNGMTTLKTSTGNKDTDKLAFTFEGWQLDNTSKQSYLGRNLGNVVESATSDLVNGHDKWYAYYSDKATVSSQKFRFTGIDQVNVNETVAAGYNLFRTYWAIDPSYDKDFNLGVGTEEAQAAAKTAWDAALRHDVTAETTTNWLAVGTSTAATPQYCYENTFDVAHQNERYTTRAIVKAKFNGGTTFYTTSTTGTQLLANADMIKAVKAAALSDGAILAKLAEAGISAGEGQVTVTMDATASGKAGTQKVTGIVIADKTDGEKKYTCTTTENGDIDRLNKLLNIQQYLGGMAYYRVLIKHFGDDLTPWNSADHLSTAAYADNTTTATIENATIDRYLGRYGVVRNNWYDITVTDIKALGEATVPDVTNNDTDDKVESYIAVKINILSWAKRTQNVVL